jgi:hypothetical protein
MTLSGLTGLMGLSGLTGLMGLTGLTGLMGLSGLMGPTGLMGVWRLSSHSGRESLETVIPSTRSQMGSDGSAAALAGAAARMAPKVISPAAIVVRFIAVLSFEQGRPAYCGPPSPLLHAPYDYSE